MVKHKCEGWFQFIRETLYHLLKQRNELLHSLNRCSEYIPEHIADHMKSELKPLQNHINDMTELAKSMWYYELGFKIRDMNMNSRAYW